MNKKNKDQAVEKAAEEEIRCIDRLREVLSIGDIDLSELSGDQVYELAWAVCTNALLSPKSIDQVETFLNGLRATERLSRESIEKHAKRFHSCCHAGDMVKAFDRIRPGKMEVGRSPEDAEWREKLYNMKLHGRINLSEGEYPDQVKKVIGGWIYYSTHYMRVNVDPPMHSAVFVPEPQAFVSATLEEIKEPQNYTHRIVRGKDGYWLYVRTNQDKHACFHLAGPERKGLIGEVLDYVSEEADTIEGS